MTAKNTNQYDAKFWQATIKMLERRYKRESKGTAESEKTLQLIERYTERHIIETGELPTW